MLMIACGLERMDLPLDALIEKMKQQGMDLTVESNDVSAFLGMA